MKKILTIALVIGCLVLASSAFGATVTGSTTLGTVVFSISAGDNCEIASESVTTSTTPGTHYTVACGHTSGTTQYCTFGGNDQSADYSKIYRKGTAGAPSSVAATDGCTTGWTPF